MAKTAMGRKIGKTKEKRAPKVKAVPTRADGVSRGENHPAHVLTAKDVRAIRVALQHPDVSKRGLARMYNVSPRTIQNIERGEAWAHLD